MNNSKYHQRITIRDIAKRLHLSHPTVSRALNDHPRISDETKRIVQETARTLNYKPNIMARGLSTRKTSLIGLVIRDIRSSFHAEIIAGVQDVLERHGHSIVLCSSDKNSRDEKRHLEIIFDKHVEGIILVPVSGNQQNVDLLEKINTQGIPLVLIASPKPGVTIPCVKVNNELGGYLATKHLLELGHKNIVYLTFSTDGFVSVPVGRNENVDRYKGYIRALKEYSLLDKEKVCFGDTYKKIKELVPRLFKKSPRPTAIFAFSDEMAIEVLRVSTEIGFEVPRELSIVGFDDLPYSSLVYPGLTTIAQPKKELGSRAARKLLQLIRGHDESDTTLMPKLIIRESTGVPKKK